MLSKKDKEEITFFVKQILDPLLEDKIPLIEEIQELKKNLNKLEDKFWDVERKVQELDDEIWKMK